MRSYNYRDFTIIELGDKLLAMACDSAGAIGMKPLDHLAVDMEDVAYITGLVVLKELTTINAKLMTVFNGVINEMKPTGEASIRGIERLINELDHASSITLNGSTEENFETEQSGLHIVMTGYVDGEIPSFKGKSGQLVLIGRPLVGQEVIDEAHLSISLKDLSAVRKAVKGPMYMVGSKGISGEIKQIEMNEKVTITLKDHVGVDTDKSGGPGCCCLVMVTDEEFVDLLTNLRCPMQGIGEIHGIH